MLFVQSKRENRAVNMSHVIYTEAIENPNRNEDVDQFVLIAHMIDGKEIPIAYGDDMRVLEERLRDLAGLVTIPRGFWEYGEICDEVPF